MPVWDPLNTSAAQRGALEGLQDRPGFYRWAGTNPWQAANPPSGVVPLTVNFIQDEHLHRLVVWKNGAITGEVRVA